MWGSRMSSDRDDAQLSFNVGALGFALPSPIVKMVSSQYNSTEPNECLGACHYAAVIVCCLGLALAKQSLNKSRSTGRRGHFLEQCFFSFVANLGTDM